MIEILCQGKRCIVVGSAPGLVIPDRRPGDIVLGANGGAALAHADILVTTAHLFRLGASRQEEATLESLRGLSVRSVWVDERNGPSANVERQCDVLGISFERMHGVSPAERDSVVRAATGVDGWVSTGVWAACLAIASGAASVVLAGISGDGGNLKHHAAEDRTCLSALISRGHLEVVA